jgi:hypothetical protein
MQILHDIKMFIGLIVLVPTGLFVATMLILKILYVVEVINYEHTKHNKEEYLLKKLQE